MHFLHNLVHSCAEMRRDGFQGVRLQSSVTEVFASGVPQHRVVLVHGDEFEYFLPGPDSLAGTSSLVRHDGTRCPSFSHSSQRLTAERHTGRHGRLAQAGFDSPKRPGELGRARASSGALGRARTRSGELGRARRRLDETGAARVATHAGEGESRYGRVPIRAERGKLGAARGIAQRVVKVEPLQTFLVIKECRN